MGIDWSKAPEGATHAMIRRGHGATGVTWFKKIDESTWRVWSRYDANSFLRWCESPGTRDGDHFIPRPTKTEWVDGLPPVGFTHNDCELNGVEGFREGFEVVAHRRVAAIVWGPCEDDPEGQVETLLACHFRPLQTPEQRQREELQKLVWDKWGFGAHQVADAILQWMKDNNLTEK